MLLFLGPEGAMFEHSSFRPPSHVPNMKGIKMCPNVFIKSPKLSLRITFAYDIPKAANDVKKVIGMENED